jgi:hypothetical protein
MSLFDQKIEELNVQVAEFEKNKDAAYADQARKKIKAYEELKSKFAPLVAVTQEE